MSAVSGGVGLGAGVGRGRESFTPPFAATAPTARIRTANATLINLVGGFICSFFHLSSLGICRPKFWSFFRNRKNFSPTRDCWGGDREAHSLTNRDPSARND